MPGFMKTRETDFTYRSLVADEKFGHFDHASDEIANLFSLTYYIFSWPFQQRVIDK